ncbi:MAG: hypothetical protein NVSMB19_25640 [Vulcanimicrobiaceae bacterium]
MITVGLGIALALSQPNGETVSLLRAPQATSDIRTSLPPEATARPAIAEDVAALLAALNTARASSGLRPLVLDPRLCAIAQSHGIDMATRRYFDHLTPEGVTPFGRLDRAHYRYGYAGENLALDRDAASAHHALLLSSEHRSNMLEPHYARVGIATIGSATGQIFVEEFSD